MKRLALPLFVLTALSTLPGLVPAAAAQAAALAQVRGLVIDEEGQPLPQVVVEMETTLEGGRKKTVSQKTDKRGGFVRVGLVPGMYKIVFSKDGYEKRGVDIYFSPGGLSEIPDVVMKKAKVAVSIGGQGDAGPAGQPGPAGAGPAGAGQAGVAETTPEEAAKLGAAYTAGMEAIKAGQWDAAEASLKEVAEKLPGNPQVHYNLGYVYRQKKDLASAEAEYKRVIELEPDKPDAYVALAAAYTEAGRGAEGVDLLTKAAPGFEQNASFHVAMGALAMNSGRAAEAEAAFAKAVALDPSNVEVQFHLASLALGRNDVADAIGHLEAYLAGASPESPNVEVAKKLLEALKAKKK